MPSCRRDGRCVDRDGPDGDPLQANSPQKLHNSSAPTTLQNAVWGLAACWLRRCRSCRRTLRSAYGSSLDAADILPLRLPLTLSSVAEGGSERCTSAGLHELVDRSRTCKRANHLGCRQRMSVQACLAAAKRREAAGAQVICAQVINEQPPIYSRQRRPSSAFSSLGRVLGRLTLAKLSARCCLACEAGQVWPSGRCSRPPCSRHTTLALRPRTPRCATRCCMTQRG